MRQTLMACLKQQLTLGDTCRPSEGYAHCCIVVWVGVFGQDDIVINHIFVRVTVDTACDGLRPQEMNATSEALPVFCVLTCFVNGG